MINFNATKSIINYAINEDYNEVFGNSKNGYMCNGNLVIMLDVSLREGIILKIVGFDEIIENIHVCTHVLLLHEGDYVPNSGDIKQRVAEFMLVFSNKNEIRDFLIFFYNTFKVLDINSNNLIVSKVEFDRINN